MIPQGACRHGLMLCPTCLGARNPVSEVLRGRKAGPMKDRRKKRSRMKSKAELRKEIANER